MIQLPDIARPWLDTGRRFLSWWGAEVVASLPRSLKQRFARGARTDIYLSDESVVIHCHGDGDDRHLQEGRPIDALDQVAWDELAAQLVDRYARVFLRDRDVLEIDLDVPRKAGRNLPSVIAMQLQLISPIQPDQVAWTWAATEVDRERAKVTVVLARKTKLEALDASFARQGLKCPPLWGKTTAGPMRLMIGRRLFLSADASAERKATHLCLAMLCLLPILIFLGAQLLIVTNEAQLNIGRHETAEKRQQDRLARREARIWQAYAPLRHALAASTILSELSARAPSGASVENIRYSSADQISFDLVGKLDEADLQSFVNAPGRLTVNWPDDIQSPAERLSFTADIQ